jgi:hypothetical protein
MENLTSVDLTPFFNQWYFGEGYPTYSLKWNQVGNDVALEISHMTSMQLITPTFTNPIDIRFTRQGQADTIIRFNLHSNQDQFSVYQLGTLSGTPTIDPNNWIMNKVGTVSQDPSLVLGISSIEPTSNICVFPNPSNENIEVTNGPEGTYSLSVMDMSGKVIFMQNVTNNEGIRLNELSNGTYIFSFLMPNGQRKTMLHQIKK